ncbi:hypothetical protein P691DRAFT_802436 [Macrolepiota fuliginosa MF-IS2]|uniref:Uncharacterized protein n=1 Tax=Macrolepiota fuliginosa MF-IS2 TaxID=1400762 RepID=A0A9P6C9D2_9AGAR|nr:hypothetical protein P691DRAFT_802436 [Macrolepiota fuliginosa MF-IS2]
MEAERLRQVLMDLSDTLVSLQQQIEQANELLVNPTLFAIAPSSRSSTGSERRSPSVSQSPQIRKLEGRIEGLEASERELATHLEGLTRQHGLCETEIADAVRGREGITQQYRLLIRVTAQLLEVRQSLSPLFLFVAGVEFRV